MHTRERHLYHLSIQNVVLRRVNTKKEIWRNGNPKRATQHNKKQRKWWQRHKSRELKDEFSVSHNTTESIVRRMWMCVCVWLHIHVIIFSHFYTIIFFSVVNQMHQPLLSSHACQKTFAFTLLHFVSPHNLYLLYVCAQHTQSECERLCVLFAWERVLSVHNYQSVKVYSYSKRTRDTPRTNNNGSSRSNRHRWNKTRHKYTQFYYFSSFTHRKFQVQHIYVICIVKTHFGRIWRKKKTCSSENIRIFRGESSKWK